MIRSGALTAEDTKELARALKLIGKIQTYQWGKIGQGSRIAGMT